MSQPSDGSDDGGGLAKDQIARQFSRAAETYDQVAQLQHAMADHLLQRIPLDATGTLADFGCGTGRSLEWLSENRSLKLLGIDIAAGMIEFARRRLPREVGLIISDFETTGLPDNRVDILFSNAAIQWSRPRNVFSEMARVLVPDGRLLLSTFGPSTMVELDQAWKAIGDPSSRVHPLPSRDTLIHELEQAGFVVVHCFSEIERTSFQTIDDLFSSIKRLGATNALTSRSQGMLGKAKYLALRDYLTQRMKADGRLVLTFESIFFEAQFKPVQQREKHEKGRGEGNRMAS